MYHRGVFYNTCCIAFTLHLYTQTFMLAGGGFGHSRARWLKPETTVQDVYKHETAVYF